MSSFEPGSAPTITQSVLAETLPLTLPPRASISDLASALEKDSRVPVTTIVWPESLAAPVVLVVFFVAALLAAFLVTFLATFFLVAFFLVAFFLVAFFDAPPNSRLKAASFKVLMPSCLALSALEPASVPTTTQSVLLETLPVTLPPKASISFLASALE